MPTILDFGFGGLLLLIVALAFYVGKRHGEESALEEYLAEPEPPPQCKACGASVWDAETCNFCGTIAERSGVVPKIQTERETPTRPG